MGRTWGPTGGPLRKPCPPRAAGDESCLVQGAPAPRASPLFLFVCTQVSASRMAAAGLSCWCSRWVCRASGGREGAGETLSAQASHKHQGAHYILTTPAFSVVPKIPTRLCGGPGLERSGFSQCQIGRSRSPLSRELQRFAFSPGGLGCGGSELGRIRGQSPSCWDVRASCFFLPAVV